MVAGQLLRLSSAMSSGVLDIYSSLSLLYYTFSHHAVAIDYMNVHFLITNITKQTTVQDQKSAAENGRPKKSNFSSAWEYVKLPFSLRVPKNITPIFFQ
jgi:hypothetical protein